MDPRPPWNPAARSIVLLVDEREEARAFAALTLAASGFDIMAAQGAPDARTRASAVRPDVIVVHLPTSDGDGFHLLRDLHADPHTRDVPLVALVGANHGLVRQRAATEGISAVFVDAAVPDELAATLRRVLDRNPGRN